MGQRGMGHRLGRCHDGRTAGDGGQQHLRRDHRRRCQPELEERQARRRQRWWGGKQKAKEPTSAQASKSKQKGEGKEPIVRSFPGDAYTGNRSDKVANHGAFPSSIKVSSSLLPVGGANDVTMRLVWQYYDPDPVMAVWNASTRVSYRWERWNVTNEVAATSREEVEQSYRQKALDAAAKVDDQYSDYDKHRRIARVPKNRRNIRRT